MKLHELEEGKKYIGEDGEEYIHDGWHLSAMTCSTAVSCYATLTQNFTPKKVKRIIEVKRWVNKYQNGDLCYHATKEIADSYAVKSRIACFEMVGKYEIEVEE